MRVNKARQSDWGGRGDTENRRDVILRALNNVLRAHPRPQSFRMKDLSDYLGLVKGNLYYYFKSKHDLLYEGRIRCLQQSLEVLEKVSSATSTSSQKLATLIREHILVLIEGQYSAALLLEAGPMTPARRRKYVGLRDEFEAGMRQDVRMASFAILGAINWMPKWYKPGGASSGADIAEYQARFFVGAVKAGKGLPRLSRLS